MSKPFILSSDDESPALTRSDIDQGLLVRRQRAADGRLLPLGGQRVTLDLEEAVVAHFGDVAAAVGWETLINAMLRANIAQEETIRRVVREALQPPA
jgi:uncharacterized protein (DUF4415 family)